MARKDNSRLKTDDAGGKGIGKRASRSFLSMFKRAAIGGAADVNILEEEALRTPGKIVLLNLLKNKLFIIGAVGFICILLFSFVGSQIWPLSKTYIELTHSSIRPGRTNLVYPDELKDKEIVKIVSGVSFSVALTSDGNLTVWGIECNRRMRSVSDLMLTIPRAVREANIVDVQAGTRFVICMDDEGNFYGWGHHANGQTTIPDNVAMRLSLGRVSIVEMAAETQWSAILGSDGQLYVWGSRQSMSNFMVPRDAEFRIVDIAAGANNMILRLEDGTLRPIGMAGTEFYEQVPEELMDGSVRVVKVEATNRNVMAMCEDGRIYLWGSPEGGLNRLPDDVRADDIKDFSAGYKNFIVVHNDGSVVIWGSGELGQLRMPKDLEGVSRVEAGMFQFYAIDGNDRIIDAWGHKGYLWGSDQFGRDMFTRVIHGGRISLSVGAIAVVISIFLAILIGLNSGFFGGWIDHALMRLADIVEALPFFPIAVTISFVVGHRMEDRHRMYLIMVVIGVLGWTGLARLIRAQLLLEREKDFVLAARALGIKQSSIMFKHILPNVFNLIIVSMTLGYAGALLTEAGLSFLGFGVIEPDPSWGNMLTSAEQSTVIQFFWWRWIIPAIFVVAAALSINLVGDALREAMDPRSQER